MRSIQGFLDDFTREIQERPLSFDQLRTSQRFIRIANQYLKDISGSDPVPRKRKEYKQLENFPLLLRLTNAYVQTVLRKKDPQKAEQLLRDGKRYHKECVQWLRKARPDHGYLKRIENKKKELSLRALTDTVRQEK